LIAALLFAVGFALLPWVTPDTAPANAGTLYRLSDRARLVSGTVMFTACGLYCGSLWSNGRRTLAMKTWGLALETASGATVGAGRAILRYLACLAGPALAVAGFIALEPAGRGRWALALLAFNYAWAAFDRDRRFLQDRIAGTRLVLDSTRASRGSPAR